MKKLIKEKFRRILDVYDMLRKEKLPRLLTSLLVIIALLGAAGYYVEHRNPDALIKSIGDGIWWGFVTISTTGYGDKYPITWAGRIIGIIMMGSGMVLTIIISGIIASILVDRKMKEGKGLQKINIGNHIIICGWNQNGEKVLQGFQTLCEKLKTKLDIVLINELEIEISNEFQFTYNAKYLSIEFIRGNFTHEQVLEKANIRKAKSVIIMADTSGENSISNADERTVLAAYTITNLNPGAKISVELVKQQNEQYLKRTGITSSIINGEFNSFLLVNSALYPGVSQAVKEMLSFSLGREISTRPISSSLVGKNFELLFKHIKDKENSLLIGIISETKKLSIDDFLTEDPSAIDDFIKRKFAESELDYFADTGGKLNVMVNPGWDYVIKDNDKALVIGEVKLKQ